jgi:hypothetical protein
MYVTKILNYLFFYLVTVYLTLLLISQIMYCYMTGLVNKKQKRMCKEADVP